MSRSESAAVLETIRDLEGWSEYIISALTLRRSPEPAAVDLLEAALGEGELRRLRELSWPLFDNLHRIRTLLELSTAEPPAREKAPA